MLVYINPGHNLGVHGKYDSGAIGSGGLTEAEVTKDMAERVCHLLRARQVNCVTEITDFEHAAKRANELHADLCVSIHCNAATDARAHGSEVWYHSEKGQVLAKGLLTQIERQVIGGKSPWLSHAACIVSRGIKAGDFYILRATHMPCALCELAFISYPQEELLLRDAHFRQAMAQAIADRVQIYLAKER